MANPYAAMAAPWRAIIERSKVTPPVGGGGGGGYGGGTPGSFPGSGGIPGGYPGSAPWAGWRAPGAAGFPAGSIPVPWNTGFSSVWGPTNPFVTPLPGVTWMPTTGGINPGGVAPPNFGAGPQIGPYTGS